METGMSPSQTSSQISNTNSAPKHERWLWTRMQRPQSLTASPTSSAAADLRTVRVAVQANGCSAKGVASLLLPSSRCVTLVTKRSQASWKESTFGDADPSAAARPQAESSKS